MKLMLVDGNNLLCRAYYTPGYMNLSHNEMPTGAVFGFMKMLSNILKTQMPTHLVVCFDTERRCWRHDIYPEYKGNRNDTPEDLIPQKKYIRDCLSAFNIHWVDKQNYEADDIIASIVEGIKWLNIFEHIYILTGDRDLLQLVGQAVTVLITNKGVSDIIPYTPDNIKELYGCYAHHVPSLKALAGDHSDNIPGVPAIGPKKAAKLLDEYGSVGQILNHIDKIKGKAGENIKNCKDLLPMYEKITKLAITCPVELRIDKWELNMNLDSGYAKLAEFGIQKIRF